jgi:NADPH:quinone reductase-like Zn-dependent oxidoreductase
MKALTLTFVEGTDTLSAAVTEIETPLPKRGEVRVTIKAASVNHRELWIMRGLYPGMRLPTTMGCDGAGVVDMLGDDVTTAMVGDEVVLYPGLDWGSSRRTPCRQFGLLGMPGPGTIAEYICVPADSVAPKPSFLNWEEAAAVPLTGLTAWRALMFKGELQAEENLLIIGIGGGVATFGLALAVARGANVYVTGGSDDVIETAIRMGARAGLNFTEVDWRKRIMPMTDGKGIDVVLDGAPSPSFANYVRSIRPGARIVIYGSTAGNEFTVNSAEIFLRSATILGTQVGDPQEFRDMLGFIEHHKIKPVVEAAFPLLQAKDALLYLQDHHRFGKVVITQGEART